MIFTVDMVAPLRAKMGISREEFGAAVGATGRTVANWETSEQPRRINAAVRNNMIKLYKRHMIGGK